MKQYTVQDGKLIEVHGDQRTVVRQASFGMGDVVASAAKAVGVKETPGCGCAKRREALNKATPKAVGRLLEAIRRRWACLRG